MYPPEVRLIGAELAKKLLLRRIKRLEDFRTPLNDIAKDFFSIEQNWLDAEGKGKWPPLSPAYARWKRSSGFPGRKMMQLTRTMYEEFTGKSKGGVRVRPSELTVRIRRSSGYWLLHQRGRQGRKRRIILSPDMRNARRRWHTIITNWIKG
jgi:hypothetical protein